MRHERTIYIVLLVAVLTLFFGCDSQRKAKSERRAPPTPPTLESASFLDITPVADGGAYATSLRGGLWYLREGQGIRVKGLPDDVRLSEVIPVADGGAYLHGWQFREAQIWYLKADTATRVHEVQALSGGMPTPRSTERWLWALFQREIGRRKAAEEEASWRTD